MNAVLANVAGGITVDANTPRLLSGTGKDQTHLLVVCTAERGLCGGFNSSIARLAREHTLALQGQGKTVKILCVGKKGADVLKRQFSRQIIEIIELRGLKSIGYVNADAIGRKVLGLYDAGEFDVCTLFFSQFRTVIMQVPTAKKLIPADIPVVAPGAAAASYEYEPDEGEILADLLPRNISVQIFRALLENGASEQGARMSAMDSATRNAGEMIKKQTMTYNRTRQAMITKELIEIISGAEAL
jgi:F-type H+-transporting ATPase subunit gamma